MLQTLIGRFCCRNQIRAYATAAKLPLTSVVSASTSTDATQPSQGFESQGSERNDARGARVRSYKPRTPGTRHLRRPINDHLWKGRPYLKLTFAKTGQGKAGRNNTGRITVRHRGGGHKRRIRTVDFQRLKGGPHEVDRIEYDPNRSAHIALLTEKATQEKSYIIAAEGMRAGDVIESYRSGIPASLVQSMGGTIDPGMLAARTAFRGNCLPAYMIPIGTQVYNVGSTTGKGAVFCRSAGTFATVVAKDEIGTKVRSVNVRLQSGEVRQIPRDACATIGVASNPNYHFRQLGKAGRSRYLGIRPTVRGLAMNAGEFGFETCNQRLLISHSRSCSRRWSRQVQGKRAPCQYLGNTGKGRLQDTTQTEPKQARRDGTCAQPGQAANQQGLGALRHVHSVQIPYNCT